MGFKEVLKKDFFESDNKLILRYKSAKAILILVIFMFFTNFFFVGAGFYTNFFSNYLSISYILLCFSIILYTFFYFKKTFLSKLSGIILYLFIFILILIFLFLLFPVIVDGGLVGFYNAYLK